MNFQRTIDSELQKLFLLPLLILFHPLILILLLLFSSFYSTLSSPLTLENDELLVSSNSLRNFSNIGLFEMNEVITVNVIFMKQSRYSSKVT
jgi:hypothetical protein